MSVLARLREFNLLGGLTKKRVGERIDEVNKLIKKHGMTDEVIPVCKGYIK